MSSPTTHEPAGGDRDNRGKRAVGGSGVATGSGAAAGGSGAPEDYDDDAVGGGGDLNQPTIEPKPDEGGDASQHGSR